MDARSRRAPETDAGAVRVALESRPDSGDGRSALVRVRLQNGTMVTVTGTIVMLAADGVLGEEFPLRLVVAPRDAGTVDVAPSLANGIPATRLVVRVRGGSAFDVDLAVPEPSHSSQLLPQLSLPSQVGRQAQPTVAEAPWLLPVVSPPSVLPASSSHRTEASRRAAPRSRPLFRYVLLMIGVGCAAAGAALAGFVLLRPNVAELSVPTPVARDSHVDIAYRLAGFGTARYRVTDADGTPIDADGIPARSGTFRVQIPADVTGRPLTVDVDVAGPFGVAHRSAALAIVATPPPTQVRLAVPPHIAMLGVDRATVSPGDDVTVSYDVSPPHGEILLADALGDILAMEPVTPAGVAKLHVPAKEQLGDVAVIVRTGGTTPAESRIPLHVLASPLPSEASTSAQLLIDASALTIRNRRVQSASPIVVHIGEPYDGLHLSLVDAKFDAVAKVDVAPGRTDAAIIAPAVSAPTQYTLEATIEHGAESSTSIYPVVVVPGRT